MSSASTIVAVLNKQTLVVTSVLRLPSSTETLGRLRQPSPWGEAFPSQKPKTPIQSRKRRLLGGSEGVGFSFQSGNRQLINQLVKPRHSVTYMGGK